MPGKCIFNIVWLSSDKCDTWLIIAVRQQPTLKPPIAVVCSLLLAELMWAWNTLTHIIPSACEPFGAMFPDSKIRGHIRLSIPLLALTRLLECPLSGGGPSAQSYKG